MRILTDLLLIALLETGGARILEVKARAARTREPCDFCVDLARFDPEALAKSLEGLAERVRELGAEPSAEALADLFGTTMLQNVDDRLRSHKAKIAAARRAA